MAAKKTEQKIEKIEREYTIPLREKCRPVPIYRKTPKAVKTVKEFLVKHMKIRDRDLKKIKLDALVNEALWQRGIRNPIHKIKVKATKEGDIVHVTLADMGKKFSDKAKRLEKREAAGEKKGAATPVAGGAKAGEKEGGAKKGKDKVEAPVGKKDEKKNDKDKDKDGVEDKLEIEEKKKSVEEKGAKEAKAEKKIKVPKTPEKQAKEEDAGKVGSA